MKPNIIILLFLLIQSSHEMRNLKKKKGLFDETKLKNLK